MTDPIRERKDKWTVVVPISGVELTTEVGHEFRIDRVTLVTTGKLQGRRRRFGLPWRLSKMRSAKHGVFKRFLDQAPVMAVLRTTGTVKELDREVVSLFRDELSILAASQLGYAKRTQTTAPAPWGERPPTQQSQLWIGSSGTWTQPSRWYGPLGALRLDAHWLQFQRDVLFVNLLRLLRNDIRIAKAWRKDLRRAAVLVGLSQAANSVADAFLWNMIALELLLTRPGDTVGDTLPSRAEALLGWSSAWTQDGFESKIRSAYERRCRLVHQGDRDSPSPEDLFFTDDLLLCLLTNLVAHPALFGSKDAVVEFSKRVEAEKLLGGKPRMRPKSLRMLRRTYNARDYDIY